MSHCMSHGAIHQPLRERPSRRRSARRAAWLAVATLVDVGRSWGARRARGLRQHAADGAFTRVPLVRRALPSRRSGTEGARSRADDLTSRALQSREWAICFAPPRDLGPLTGALARGRLSPGPPAIPSRASLLVPHEAHRAAGGTASGSAGVVRGSEVDTPLTRKGALSRSGSPVAGRRAFC